MVKLDFKNINVKVLNVHLFCAEPQKGIAKWLLYMCCCLSLCSRALCSEQLPYASSYLHPRSVDPGLHGSVAHVHDVGNLVIALVLEAGQLVDAAVCGRHVTDNVSFSLCYLPRIEGGVAISRIVDVCGGGFGIKLM